MVKKLKVSFKIFCFIINWGWERGGGDIQTSEILYFILESHHHAHTSQVVRSDSRVETELSSRLNWPVVGRCW